MKRKVLITGARGLLGKALSIHIPKGFEVFPTVHTNSQIGNLAYSKLDILDKKDVLEQFKKIKPDIVIHAASIGNVDYCEKNKDEAYKVNVDGTKNITEACEQFGAKLIFISSNAVFDGLRAPYEENNSVNPLNYYGQTKVLGEELVRNSNVDSAIARLILMYGWNDAASRANPVTWLLKKLENKEKVKLVNDTYANPIYNVHAAQAIWKLITMNKNGTYHLAGKDRMNRYEAGLAVADVFGFDREYIQQVSSDYFDGIAKRMPDTTYNTLKMQKELGIQLIAFKDCLLLMKKYIHK